MKKWLQEEYDVIVVGAGPAGSTAARECAKRGLKTLALEKRQEVGVPKRCGEGLGEGWCKIAGITPDPKWTRYEMHGATLWSPTGKKVVIPTPTKGWIIERRVFDKWLAEEAVRAGARMITKARVTGVIKEEDTVKGVIVETPDGVFEVMAKMVIAADGVDSKTAKYAGVNTVNPATEIDSGYQYEMVGLNIPEPKDMIHLYFGWDVAPRGYVWIFPKGEDHANVGIGIGGYVDEGTSKEYLDKFIQANPEIFKDAGIVETNAGGIPVGAPLKKPYANGLIIIGDAAHMVNPIHGGGIGTGMEAGILAAEIAEKAVKAKDVSENVLKEFAEKWYEKRGNQLLQVLKVRKFFEELNDNDLEKFADILDDKQLLLDFADGKRTAAFLKFLAKAPKIALKAAKHLA